MFIELTKINRSVVAAMSSYNDTDDPTENRNLLEPPPETARVMVAVEAIRCFYPRRDNAPGTRITFVDGGGFAVIEDYESVKNLVA